MIKGGAYAKKRWWCEGQGMSKGSGMPIGGDMSRKGGIPGQRGYGSRRWKNIQEEGYAEGRGMAR